MKFQNCILINFERTDGQKDAQTSPKQYAPSVFPNSEDPDEISLSGYFTRLFVFPKIKHSTMHGYPAMLS